MSCCRNRHLYNCCTCPPEPARIRANLWQVCHCPICSKNDFNTCKPEAPLATPKPIVPESAENRTSVRLLESLRGSLDRVLNVLTSWRARNHDPYTDKIVSWDDFWDADGDRMRSDITRYLDMIDKHRCTHVHINRRCLKFENVCDKCSCCQAHCDCPPEPERVSDEHIEMVLETLIFSKKVNIILSKESTNQAIDALQELQSRRNSDNAKQAND